MSFEFAYNPQLNLSWNLLEGPIHSSPVSKAATVDLSNNNFSGSASFLCDAHVRDLSFLDLSSNNLSGELPNCWTNFKSLIFLDLSNNLFSGEVPITIGNLVSIESLKLDTNKFVGDFPSLKKCTSLKAFDLEDNFSGPIPKWVGVRFPILAILVLRSNLFNGSMPSQFCNLTSIRVLDVSVNHISGRIPKCLNNLTTLAQVVRNPQGLTISHEYIISDGSPDQGLMAANYDDEVAISCKGTLSRYKNTLALVKCIDLSSNNLTGEIPSEITHLVGLVSLNLSRNHLRGQITPEIGKLRSLQSLDFSRNQLHGKIPTSAFQISGLGYLDLSYNNLSGKIPMGSQLQTYDASYFAGNPQLCGLPLERSSPPDQENSTQQVEPSRNEDDDELITQGFYIRAWIFCLILGSLWQFDFLTSLGDTHTTSS